MIVIKIGGSLFACSYLDKWLTVLQRINQSVIIVPGGGPFADQVRLAAEKCALPMDCAHDMAVLGMQQFGHLMTGINKHLVLEKHCLNMSAAKDQGRRVVWAPYDEVLAARDIEKTWQTTSDSLALWLAIKITADHLCVVKSAATEGKTIQQLAAEKVIDDNFAKLLPNYSGKIHFYHAADTQHFIDDLNSDILS